MKKLLSLLVLFPIMVFAQTQTENYIKTTTYKVASTTSITNPTIAQANQNITYFDGLGRPIQQIAHQQSGSGKDIVTPIEYDAFGRQTKEYLPYVPNTSASLDYKTNALTDVLNFPQYSGQNPFSEKELEASPLNRVMKQAAPGTDWALNSGHEIKLEYQTNTSADAVKLFAVTANWDATKELYAIPTSLTPADYLEFQLYKTITYDENTAATPSETNGSTIEFKNKEGQVVLKRTYESGEKHDTYYVYDQYGNLTFVLPPLVDATSAVTSTILDGLCYQYKYDSRNRLVEKKLPGKQWEFLVYDKLDRVVATGPAFSPFSDSVVGAVGWMITKYDVFNRPVYTGWELSATITSADRKTKQDTMNALTTISEGKTTAPTTIDSLAGIAYYTNTVAPTSFKLLTINYYDDYNFQAFTPAIAYTAPVAYNNSTLKPKGLPTGSWVRVLTTLSDTAAESSYTLYDAKARSVKTFTTNYLGGYTQMDSNLDAFSGRLNYTEIRHKRVSSDSELYIKEVYTYSAQDRLMTHTHQIGTSGTPQLLASNTYDELGQLISKNVGNTVSNPLQKVDYRYNIRGWLTEINKVAALQQGSDPKDLFGFKINYNTIDWSTSAANKLYNGNIAETFWSSGSDGGFVRAYGYKYDNLNRLKDATYQKSNLVTNAFDENLTYDKNGNIQTLIRYTSPTDAQVNKFLIDDLAYVYMPDNPNQLLKVTESLNGNDAQGFIDANKTDDYTYYDLNGNLKTDANKGITEIIYNHLNLPVKIRFETKYDVITFVFNSLGQKVGKKVVIKYTGREGGTFTMTTTVDYLAGFQYNNGVLQYFPMSEGYVKNTSGVYSYVYNYTDHLGNIRLSYAKNPTTGNLEILEENNYYPFGLKHNGYNSNNSQPNYKYKFQGQERQDELGLNWDSFKWRNYDPAIGRFMSVDPLAEKYNKWTPYAFAGNQVVHSRELEGLEPEDDLDGESARKDWTGVEGFEVPSTGGGGREAPLDGNLDEIVITNDFNAGYDPNGVIDNDRDGYEIDTERLNDAANGIGIATGIKTEIMTYAVAQNFKSASNSYAFANLRAAQQAWRTTNTLGNFGSKALSVTKGLGAVAGAIQVGLKINEINNKGYATTRDYLDIGVNTAGVVATIFMASNPIGWAIGAGALAYSIGTTIYDANNPQTTQP